MKTRKQRKQLKYKKKSQRPKKQNKRQTRKIKGGGAVPMKKMVDSIVNLAETIIKDENTKDTVQKYINEYKQLNEGRGKDVTSEDQNKNIYFVYLNGCVEITAFSESTWVTNSNIELLGFFEKILKDIQEPQDICIIIYLLLQLTILIKNSPIDYDTLLSEIKNFIKKNTYYKDLHFIDINLTYIFDIIYSYLETAGKSDEITGDAYKTIINDGLQYLHDSINSKNRVAVCNSTEDLTKKVICTLITKNHTLISTEIDNIISILMNILKGDYLRAIPSALSTSCELFTNSNCNVKNQGQLEEHCRQEGKLLHGLKIPVHEIKQQYCYEESKKVEREIAPVKPPKKNKSLREKIMEKIFFRKKKKIKNKIDINTINIVLI